MAATPYMATKLDFQIAYFAGGVCVDGRNCGRDLRVGEVFTEVAECVVIREHGAEGSSYPLHEVRQFPISWRVERIEAYRTSLPSLSSGMTARLTLAGASAELLHTLVARGGHYFHLRNDEKA